jgi:hypothetical protein
MAGPHLEVSITPEDRDWVRGLVAANPRLRRDHQAKDWIGKPLGVHLGLDPTNKVDRFRLKNLIQKLIDNSTLRVVEHFDKEGKRRPYFAT